MASVTEQYDAAFLGILQNEGKLPNFMDAVFSFLYRRTDLFLQMRHEKDTMGFPPGVAKKIVLAAFEKYDRLAAEANQLRMRAYAESKVPQVPAAKIVDVTDTDSQGDTANKPAQHVKTPDVKSGSPMEQETEKMEGGSGAEPTSVSNGVGNDAPEQTSSSEAAEKETKKSDEKEDDNSELSKMQKRFQANPESYNGAVRENYCWAQTIADLDVRVKVPKYIRRGKEVKVELGRKRLKVCHKDTSGGWTTVVDDALTWDVHKEEIIWSLVPGEHVHVNMDKVQERWWEALLESEPRISVRKIDASRPMTDLDDEAQAKIEEMVFNDHQKKMGKPQSHEKKVHSMLEKAWDAEGSPFRGQPFDPSKLNISSGGGLDPATMEAFQNAKPPASS